MLKIFFFLLLTAGIIIVMFSARPVKVKNNPVEIHTEKPRKVYTGAYVDGFWDSNNTLNTERLLEFEQIIGTKVAFTSIYAKWTYLDQPVLIEQLHQISDNGWVPIISSNPGFFDQCPQEKNQPSFYKTLASGTCDEFLRAAARNLKQYNKPVFFRFAWEMNWPNMYWSVTRLKSSPEEFVSAWRRIHTIFQEEQATNVKWVLAFNQTNPKSIPYKDLFPGDEYVDWVAIDGYNWGTSQDWSNWNSFTTVFRQSYSDLTALTDKPIMLSEVNSSPKGGDKAAWLEDMLTKGIPNEFPAIRAFVFFNRNKLNSDEGIDWRLENSPAFISTVSKNLASDLYADTYSE